MVKQLVGVFLVLSLAGCGDDGETVGPDDGAQRCAATCQRFKDCIPNLEDSPSQIWVCRCEENTTRWATQGACIEACALKSSCNDLWDYFRDTLTGGGTHLYLTQFYACETACK
jgi:hypothetical protein